VRDPEDFDSMDKVELLMAIDEACPGLSFPETVTREDLIRHISGLSSADPDEYSDEGLGAGVRNTHPRPPLGSLSAKVDPKS
jgi:hypothetical protein